MRTMHVAAIAIAAGTLVAGPARAQTNTELPFCAYGSKASEGSMRCDFTTLAQCQAWLSGGAGSCVPNPRLSTPRPQTPPARR